jgi:uncharacterized protein (DUF2252 family)
MRRTAARKAWPARVRRRRSTSTPTSKARRRAKGSSRTRPTSPDVVKVRHNAGKSLRLQVPRTAHARWNPEEDRPDPLRLIAESNAGRQSDLVPIRNARMAASLFGFYRGSATVMAWDLARTPVSGIEVLMDGDAHLANFGLFGTVERDVVFDLNDFDESEAGPWEWDLKRLVASVNVAARDLGWPRRDRHAAVVGCVEGYRGELRRLEAAGALDLWYQFLFTGRTSPQMRLDPSTRDVLRGAAEDAVQRTSETLLTQLARRSPNGSWRLRELPPIQVRISAQRAREVIEGLRPYRSTLPRGRRYLIERYHPVDVAEHVVGVGSVGARAYLVLLFGNGESDPLLLQVKEALTPAASAYLPRLPSEFRGHQGKRVVAAQMALQSSPDLLLGWTRIEGRPFYVRQLRNLKGAVPLDALRPKQFLRYVRACGEVLGHAHARTGDGARIAGYCGRSGVLDEALAEFAESYGAQVIRDHARLVRAIESGRWEARGEPPTGRVRKGRPRSAASRFAPSPPSRDTSASRKRPTSP